MEATVGDQVGYWVGRRFGPRILERLPSRLRGSSHLRASRDYVARHGAAAVFIGGWAASLHPLTPTIAGVSGVPPRRFAIANALGAMTWAIATATLGYLAAAGYRSVLSRLSISGAIVVGPLALLHTVRWWHLRRGAGHGSITKVA
jgi:membrane-associated protein